MKKAVFILLIVSFLVVITSIKAKAIVERLEVTAKLQTINLTQLFQPNSQLGVGVVLTVSNQNEFSIPLENVTATFYFEGEQVGRAKRTGKVIISPHSQTPIPVPGVLHVNKKLLELLTELGTFQAPPLTYRVKGKLFGFPLTITDEIILEQKKDNENG